jgi:glucose-6-phosphate-specific signal transduction histidine kinase
MQYPYFRTGGVYLLGLLSGLGIHLLFRFRLQQQSKLLQLRNRIQRDLHDDVGATLSSVKVYSEILKDNPNTPVIAELIKQNTAEMIDCLEVMSWAADVLLMLSAVHCRPSVLLCTDR